MATGAVWFDVILPKTDNVDVRTVVFSPNRRTVWREHEHGRLLQITSGYGFLCREGGFSERGRPNNPGSDRSRLDLWVTNTPL